MTSTAAHRTPDWRFRAALAFVVLTALALRMFGLESNPPGLWQDEASTGLDALHLWRSGRDRFGVPWPVACQSFGDYPLALYRYLTAPIVGLLGLTPGHERWVAALSGTTLVGATIVVVRSAAGRTAAIAAGCATALSPMALHFSRYGSEAILLPTCLCVGWACVRSAAQRPRMLWGAATALALSAYTYHAVKLVLPLWLSALAVAHRQDIAAWWRHHRGHLVGASAWATLLIGPALHFALTERGMARQKTVLAWYFHDGFELVRVMLGNYLSYFDLGLLFIRGGPAAAQSMPGLGLFHLLELPLILAGLSWALRHRSAFTTMLLFWCLIGPLPGGITYETENVGRAIAWLPAPHILAGIGFHSLWSGPADVLKKWVLRSILGAGTAASVAWLGYVAFIRYPAETRPDFQYEISEAIRCAQKSANGRTIVLSPSFHLIHVFAAFHFADTAPGPGHRRPYRIARRKKVTAGEVYAAPSGERAVDGHPICRIRHRFGQAPAAFVYEASGPVEESARHEPPPPPDAAH